VSTEPIVDAEITETGLERFRQKPVIDRIEPRTLELIQKTIAVNCAPAEIGHFLELCAHYQLDPFAREAWIAKSKSGKLLIMVGRDGLRRIAQRNGIHLDGDVVRANDEFAIQRTADGNRTVTHSYGKPSDRGEIVGAWAECREGGPEGRSMGYFYAPLEEYQPASRDAYSPWSKQVGVMILGAAERQAVRQATPLSGLLAEGEDELVENSTLPAGSVRQLAELTAVEEINGESELDSPLTDEEREKLGELIDAAGLDDNKLRMHLVAVGVDCTDDLNKRTAEELRALIDRPDK
jgi:RecT family